MRPLAGWSPAMVIVAVLVSGCAGSGSDGLSYDWGIYDGLVYDMYAKPGEATPTVQISLLSAQIEQTKSAGLKVPPGVHAHLGYMQYIAGNIDAALDEFDQERANYPESATFIDKIIGQLRQE